TFQGIAFPGGSVLVAIAFMYLEMLLIIAVTLVFGVFTSSLLASLLSFGTYMVGHLSTDLIRLGKLAKSDNIERIVETIYLVLPDLERLNLKNEAIYGAALLPAPGALAIDAIYGLLYTALLLVIAGNIFTRRQF
ncbi:MAG: ABC transporter permease, partial [Moorea sp. SIO3C2]|nr:ABC transporter permease [Moorena sp. SIO3C2]